MICLSKIGDSATFLPHSYTTKELKNPETLQQPSCIAFQDISNISKVDDMATPFTTEKLNFPRLGDGKKSLIYFKKEKDQSWSCVGKVENTAEKENRSFQANLISDNKPADFQNGLFGSSAQIKSVRCQSHLDTDEDVVQPQILMSQDIGKRYKIIKTGLKMAPNNKGFQNKVGDKPVQKTAPSEVACKVSEDIDFAASKQSCTDKNSNDQLNKNDLAIFMNYKATLEELTMNFDADNDKIFIRPESKNVMLSSTMVPIIELNLPVEYERFYMKK